MSVGRCGLSIPDPPVNSEQRVLAALFPHPLPIRDPSTLVVPFQLGRDPINFDGLDLNENNQLWLGEIGDKKVGRLAVLLLLREARAGIHA